MHITRVNMELYFYTDTNWIVKKPNSLEEGTFMRSSTSAGGASMLRVLASHVGVPAGGRLLTLGQPGFDYRLAHQHARRHITWCAEKEHDHLQRSGSIYQSTRPNTNLEAPRGRR